MLIKYKTKKIEVRNIKICSGLCKFIGLMFSRRENAKNLLFEFKKPNNISIHSFFVFFPFIVIWLDDKNKVIDLKVIHSFRGVIKLDKSFHKILEIPINKKNKKIVKSLVGERFK